jgi:DNA helicase-2/ATP-dependent DNA helicase PcrA
MTRAKESLYLSYAQQRMLMGTVERSERSRFVREIPQELLAQTSTGRVGPTEWRSEIRPRRAANATFKPGEKVTHEQFGKGIVLNSMGAGDEEQVTVAFENGVGVKKLLLAYARLEKV